MANLTQRSLQTHQNHYLFSDYYLDHRVIELPEWQTTDVSAALAEMTNLWRQFAPQNDNEAQTEADWIRPVLRALGHTFNVQVSLKTPFGVRQPDYILYPDEATRQAARGLSGPLTSQDLSSALAVADAKAWERDLDRAASGAGKAARKKLTLSENPGLQIYVYVQHSGLPWGILTNGRCWRLYQRETAEKLDVYYEVDLPALIQQGDPEAFNYFYLFFRREAFMAEAGADSWLGQVLSQSRAYARGVSDTLKEQVYEALRHLAQGFFDFPTNRLDPTPATLKAIFNNSLIVLYRLLFILYAESRSLLPVPDHPVYTQSYSLEALKRRIARELDQHRPVVASMNTYWQQLRQLWAVIDSGNPDLEVPAYNGGLFKDKAGAFLTQYQVGDLHLRRAIDLLARTGDRQSRQRVFVDYRDLEIRHLGSIYEGLLEYQLRLAETPLQIRVERGREIYEPLEPGQAAEQADIPAGEVYLVTDKGERKSTGSYYTPNYIVKYIVDQTVRPVLEKLRMQHDDPAALEKAILQVNVLDPSMGSGHFLVEATDYIARYMVALELPKPAEAETESDLAYWRRRVAQNCIYGVDLNPLAVELAKLSLWLATVARGKPLSFLDHHLRCGNSLVGSRVADLPLEGVVSAQSKRKARRSQKQEAVQRAAGQLSMLDDSAFAGSMRTATNFMDQIERLRGETVAEIQEAEEIYRQVVEEVTAKARHLADVWTARAFGLALDERLWTPLARFMTHGGLALPIFEQLLQQAETIAEEYHFFHWELEFPEVFFNQHGQLDVKAGFDVVVGNPPYVRQEELGPLKDYFAQAFPEIYHGVADLYVYFLGQGVNLLQDQGRLGYITSGTFQKLNFGASLRKFLATQSTLEAIVDFEHEQVFAEALTYPIILITRKQAPHSKDTFSFLTPDIIKHPTATKVQQYVLPKEDSQWVFAHVRLKHIIEGWDNSVTLREMIDKSIYRGVSTGYNEAFIINEDTHRRLVQEDETSKEIIKPYVRGEDLHPWYQENSKLSIIFSRRGIDIDTYPAIKSYLEQFRDKLEPRPKDWDTTLPWDGRKPGIYQWYEIQDTVAYYEVFEQPRIHSTKVSLFPSFSLLQDLMYSANTSYVIPISNNNIGYYVLALLNSRVCEYYSRKVFAQKANGYYEVQPKKLEEFPIPNVPIGEREVFSEIAANITEQAKARYQLHRQSRHRILSDLGTPDQKLNQKLTAWWELDFATFRAEIKKVFKRDIPLAERDDWEAWLTDRQAKHQQYTAEIMRLETELNQRVYALYDLSPAEIKIIEESTKYQYGEV